MFVKGTKSSKSGEVKMDEVKSLTVTCKLRVRWVKTPSESEGFGLGYKFSPGLKFRCWIWVVGVFG